MTFTRVALAWMFVSLLVGLPALVVTAASLGIAEHPSTEAPWSRMPPAGLKPAEVPQFVAVTFDDNFGLAVPGSVGGVSAMVEFYVGKHNPVGRGNAADFDGAPIRATLFDTSIYMIDASRTVLGGKRGEDHGGLNRAAWRSAIEVGLETADHTVNHFNGGGIGTSREACCRPRNWSVAQWRAEIASCRTTLTDPRHGLGAHDVIGFRAPFLSYNDNLFTALHDLGFAYDSSVPNCFDDAEDGTNCSWPYSLNQGSKDADSFARTLNAASVPRAHILLPAVKAHPGLWELPPTTLVIPPDTLADRYGFAAGMRDRVAAGIALSDPSVYQASSAKIYGGDYTLLIDAGVTGDEMRAILEYNLDLHLSGNRSPLIFDAHAHLYAFSTPDDNPDTPTDADRKARWQGLTDFITYALTRPEVRVVTMGDVLVWMQAAASHMLADSHRR
jgi:hypothetical protein